MAIRWQEFLAHLEHYKKVLPSDEPIVLPRREAKRRAVNREKRRRVCFVVDEQGYSEWNSMSSRYIDLCGENPTIARHIMVKILSAVSDEVIRGLAHDGTT